MNSTSLEKIQSPVSGFCYVRNRVCNVVCRKDFPVFIEVKFYSMLNLPRKLFFLPSSYIANSENEKSEEEIEKCLDGNICRCTGQI